jgi:hypothetical protein
MGHEDFSKPIKPKVHHEVEEPKSLWQHLADATLTQTNHKFQQFLGVIDRAHCEKETLFEMQKKKLLREFCNANKKNGLSASKKVEEMKRLEPGYDEWKLWVRQQIH